MENGHNRLSFYEPPSKHDRQTHQIHMTHSLQIAVAKAMGWKYSRLGLDGRRIWVGPSGDFKTEVFEANLPPLTLDLMLEAEEMLKGDERWKYAEMMIDEGTWFDAVHSTAEQRAKAWLKVKGISVE